MPGSLVIPFMNVQALVWRGQFGVQVIRCRFPPSTSRRRCAGRHRLIVGVMFIDPTMIVRHWIEFPSLTHAVEMDYDAERPQRRLRLDRKLSKSIVE